MLVLEHVTLRSLSVSVRTCNTQLT